MWVKDNEFKELSTSLNQGNFKVFAGFDGFVDQVIHVVDQRQDEDNYSRIKTIEQFARRIAAAAGLSTNIEYVPIQTKLGGNGPIFAYAMARSGHEVFYTGALGQPLESVFQDMAHACRELVSLGPSAHTDAVEFQDGKLIISKMESLKEITPERLLESLGKKRVVAELEAADLICLANWTMLPHMSAIWRLLLDEILPQTEKKGFAFFDLADPRKRSDTDLSQALQLISAFQEYRQVVLGLNLSEAKQVARILGLEMKEIADLARRLAENLRIHGLVIHLTDKAYAYLDGKKAVVEGPYCQKPFITTGAGDHFNAGFCQGLLRGRSIEECLLLGVASSGYYVRCGKSPDIYEIQDFFTDWFEGKLDLASDRLA